MHDMLIRKGTVVDGTGTAPFTADVAVTGGRIVAIGKDLGAARETLDADGLLVTPGFIDVHTHYDGQVMWDSTLAPTVWHGVTTAIIGNCGVGFAPAAPANRQFLIDLMSNVEDIPAAALASALDWSWESFPEYLDAIAARPHTIDVAAMLTMASLRTYVMGAADACDDPDGDQLARMADLTRQAMEAGAVGLSSSRTILHASPDGRAVPGTYAGDTELIALTRAMRKTGRGLLEVSPAGIAFDEPVSIDQEVDWILRVAKAAECPIMFLLTQSHHHPNDYKGILARCEQAQRDGIPIYPQVTTRPTANMLGFQGENHPFRAMPSYAAVAKLPHAERIRALHDPGLRARILSEKDPNPSGLHLLFADPDIWRQLYVMGEPLNYYPSRADSIMALAQKAGVTPQAMVYDKMLEQDGRGFVMYAVTNWAGENEKPLHDMMTSPFSIIGLNDGGAHLMATTDSSQPTTMLTRWARDRDRDDPHRLPVEFCIRKLARDNAVLFGLHDRGVLAAGKKADINLIDFDSLQVGDPVMVHDLPTGAPRLDQRSTGYAATLVGGQVILRHGELTGATPGGVARGI